MPVERIKSFPFPHIKSIEDMEKWGKELHRCLTEDQYERAMDFNDIVIDTLVANNIHIKNTGELRFYDNGNYVGFEPPALSADQIWVLPNADGSANEVLGTDNSGNLIWRTHNELAAYDSNDHIDHTSVSISGGGLISGGGTIAANRILTLTEATIETAIDTLANLTSIQGQTISLSGSLTVEANSIINQDLSTDATAVQLGRLGLGVSAATNPLQISAVGTVSGWGGAYGGVVARFNCTESKHTSICIDALTGYDPVLAWSENGAAMWDFRNDASATDTFNIRYQVGAVNSTYFAINNAGKVGIGTSVIPHGGNGYAKFALEGVASSAAGPHIQYTVSTDDHPVFQQLNWAHDNIALALDAYYDGGWKSGDAGSNFMIRKYGDELKISYDSSVNAGSTITWNTGLAISATGAFDFQSNNLATLGTITWSGGGSANANTAYTHVSSCGADHGYLDQSVISGANVTFGTIGSGDITVADGSSINLQEDITFTGATTENLIKIPDHLAVALDITEASNSYLKFVTTNAGEKVVFGKLFEAPTACKIGNLTLGDGSITDSSNAIDFGNEVLTTSGRLVVDNSSLSITDDHIAIQTIQTKTGGVSDYSDDFTALRSVAIMNDGSNGIGHIRGYWGMARHSQGDIGGTGNVRRAVGVEGEVDLVGGKIYGSAYGMYAYADQGAGHEVTGDLIGSYIIVDADGTVGGNAYGLYILEGTNIDYGIYQSGTAKIYLGGNTGLGQSTFGTNATKTLALSTGVAPTSSPADCFQVYSADIGGAAGKAGVHFRDEAGNVTAIGDGKITDSSGAISFGDETLVTTGTLGSGAITSGTDGSAQGSITLWDGGGGNTPGFLLAHSPNGTAWYIFVEDDGTVKVHNASPTANADGDAIGDQTD